ncbi:MAG: DUF416 family protein [Bacteroidota bacterium]|nr:DUF416 family protein [Bacteroidota bacterium]MDP4258863.1 DUF416 family protein [Bacteroidota bacterium]
MAIQEINQLKDLDSTKQMTFAYLTCERLYPNYVNFSRQYNFGDPEILKDALDRIYRYLLYKEIDKEKLILLIKEVEENTPEPGDFDSILASSALDACTAIIESLNSLVNDQPPQLDNISVIATDTVSMYIHDRDNLDYNTDTNFHQKIDNDPLMLKEISTQKGIISYLSKIDNIQPSDIVTLINLQENNKGNLGL